MRKKTRRDHAEDAAKARCDLNAFHGVIAFLEGGIISSDGSPDADKIIRICKSANQKALRRYDRALMKVDEAA